MKSTHAPLFSQGVRVAHSSICVWQFSPVKPVAQVHSYESTPWAQSDA